MFQYARLPAAVAYAAEAHRLQARKGTANPYFSHPMGVASLVLENGGNEDQAIAGLLHDILEDCGGAHEVAIREAFGDRVAHLVLGCTDALPDAEGEKGPWKDRKDAYLEHLRTADNGTILVSACDKLHNARAIAADLLAGQDVFERFTADRAGTLWYYRALHSIFSERLGKTHNVVLQLGSAVAAMSGGDQAVARGVDSELA
jgi:(p)ppGpp synthase/HD superfamily hydrolase